MKNNNSNIPGVLANTYSSINFTRADYHSNESRKQASHWKCAMHKLPIAFPTLQKQRLFQNYLMAVKWFETSRIHKLQEVLTFPHQLCFKFNVLILFYGANAPKNNASSYSIALNNFDLLCLIMYLDAHLN